MLIGYARVSTDDQNLDLRRDALHSAGCEKIYEDRISGAKLARGLAVALEIARSGDVPVLISQAGLPAPPPAGRRRPRLPAASAHRSVG